MTELHPFRHMLPSVDQVLRTPPRDYAQAIGPNTCLILEAPTFNYLIHGSNLAPINLFASRAAQTDNGGVPLPVGRPDFKSGWGRQTVSGGFDSHPPPPRSREVRR